MSGEITCAQHTAKSLLARSWCPQRIWVQQALAMYSAGQLRPSIILCRCLISLGALSVDRSVHLDAASRANPLVDSSIHSKRCAFVLRTCFTGGAPSDALVDNYVARDKCSVPCCGLMPITCSQTQCICNLDRLWWLAALHITASRLQGEAAAVLLEAGRQGSTAMQGMCSQRVALRLRCNMFAMLCRRVVVVSAT